MLSASDKFGASVAVDNDKLVIGAYGRQVSAQRGGNEGEAFVYLLDDGAWRAETNPGDLAGSDATGGDSVGYAVAIHGDHIILGAPQISGRAANSLDPNAQSTDGASYAFIRTVSPPQVVVLPTRQQDLIAGAMANRVTGTLGTTTTSDLIFFDIPDVTIATGAANDTVTLTNDLTDGSTVTDDGGLTAFGLQNFTIDLGAGDDELELQTDQLTPTAVGDFQPLASPGGLNNGDPLPSGVSYVPITGAFTYNGGSGTNTVTVSHDGDWELQQGSVIAENGESVTVNNVSDANLHGGDGSNVYTLTSWTGNITADGGGGADFYNVHAAAVNGTVISDSADAPDTLTLLGTDASETITVEDNELSLGTATLAYSGIEVLNIAGGEGIDAIEVNDSGAGVVNLDGEGDSDTYDIDETTVTVQINIRDGGPFAAVGADVDSLIVPDTAVLTSAGVYQVGTNTTVNYDGTIEGYGATTLSANESFSGTSGVDRFVLTATTLEINGALYDITPVQTLSLDGLGGNDQFVIQGMPVGLTLTLVGGSDSDTIEDTVGAATWTITGNGVGTVSGSHAFSFSGIENITTGDGNDNFVFSDNTASIGGSLDGGAGSNTLNYTGRTTAIAVDLGAATATAIGGTIDGITNLVGSAATTDTLTGPDQASTWNLTGLNSGNINGTFFFSSIENLIGGDGNDTFVVSNGAGVTGTMSGGAGTDTLVIQFTGANDVVVVSQGQIQVNGTSYGFGGFENLQLNTLGGVDDITLSPATSGFPASIAVDGGDGADLFKVNLAAGAVTDITLNGGAPRPAAARPRATH